MYWRAVARAAGIPDDLLNRDSRAGGVTEGSDPGAHLEHLRHHASHSSATITARYSRKTLTKTRAVARSKKKGMWMGGNVPLGYDASERTLVIDPAEAETVRRFFALYRELGCMRRVKEEADRLGLRTKCGTMANGAERGGKPFSRGHLYTLLSNPIYAGQIAHKGEFHPGQQPALIDDETWTAVRNQLAANVGDHQRKAKAAEPSLLAGLLVDARRERLTPSHAVKKGRRYRGRPVIRIGGRE